MLLNHHIMNIFDIITIIILILAALAGWRKGFTTQLLSLLSIVGGILLASAYGAEVGAALKIDPVYSKILGYVITFLATALAASLLSRVLSGIFAAMGLGGLDSVLGVALSALKYLLILSVAYIAIERFNNSLGFIEDRHFEESKSFNLVASVSGMALNWFNTFAEEGKQ